MSEARLPAIPTPSSDNVLASVQALKQAVEMLSGQLGGTGPGSTIYGLVESAAKAGAASTVVGSGTSSNIGGLISDINSLTTLINTLIAQARREFNDTIEEAQLAASQAVADLNTAFGELRELINVQGTTITSLQSQTNNNAASVTTEAATRATADSAIAGQITTITANVASNAAAITSEAVVRATADTALSGQLTTLTSRVNGNAAAISSEAITRATADGATSVALTNVSAVASRQRVFSQSTAPTAQGVGDVWIDTANGNLIKYWDGSQWLARDDARVAVNAANISNETIARATADSAIAAQINALTSTVSGNAATINNEAATRATADLALSGQISRLSATVSNNAASLQNESYVRAAADSALSAQVTTVEARTNAGTANGRMQLVAASINDGTVATEFSVQVSATGATGSYATTGLRMQSMSNGTSRVLVDADTFIIKSSSSTSGYVPFAVVNNALLPQFNVPSTSLAFGPGDNLLSNTTFNSGTEAWIFSPGDTGLPVTGGLDYAGYALAGGHTLYAYINGSPTIGKIFDIVANNAGRGFTVQPNKRYEFSAYVGGQRVDVYIQVFFFNSAGTLLTYPVSSSLANALTTSGVALSSYTRLSFFATAPANAASAHIYVRAKVVSNSDPYKFLFMTRPFMGEARDNQTEFSSWSPGAETQFGSANQITSSNISTFIANAAIDLARINTASIGTLSAFTANIGEVTAGVVRSSDGQTVFDLTNGNLTIYGT